MSQGLNSLDDSQLITLANGGSVAAFEAIYERHAGGVARALASFAGPDRDLLDDLVQEVFLRLVKGLSSYTPSHPFPQWLYTVALNVGRNHVRRASKLVPMNPADFDGIMGSVEPSDPTGSLTLTRLVARLPVTMREVVSLRAGAEMTYGEIAELLGIPEGTARSRMHKALGILRGHYDTANGIRSREND